MHLVETIAYAGQQPCHGLGERLAGHQPVEVLKEPAWMDWNIDESKVRDITGQHGIGTINAFPG